MKLRLGAATGITPVPKQAAWVVDLSSILVVLWVAFHTVMDKQATQHKRNNKSYSLLTDSMNFCCSLWGSLHVYWIRWCLPRCSFSIFITEWCPYSVRSVSQTVFPMYRLLWISRITLNVGCRCGKQTFCSKTKWQKLFSFLSIIDV